MSRHSSAGSKREATSPADGGGKRARILDAAVRVFADKGFFNAKVSEIAQVAGVADGTIYLYFKSKDDLLISLFEERMAEVNSNVRAALAAAAVDDPVAKIRSVVRLHLELVEKFPHLAEVLTVELRQSARFMKEYANPKFGEFLKLLAQPIEEGQRAGLFRDDLDPHVIARALFGALDELALAWLLRRRAAEPKTRASASSKKSESTELAVVAAQLAELFVDGLRRPADAVPVKRRTS